jgi:hypothetical protein
MLPPLVYLQKQDSVFLVDDQEESFHYAMRQIVPKAGERHKKHKTKEDTKITNLYVIFVSSFVLFVVNLPDHRSRISFRNGSSCRYLTSSSKLRSALIAHSSLPASASTFPLGCTIRLWPGWKNFGSLPNRLTPIT